MVMMIPHKKTSGGMIINTNMGKWEMPRHISKDVAGNIDVTQKWGSSCSIIGITSSLIEMQILRALPKPSTSESAF